MDLEPVPCDFCKKIVYPSEQKRALGKIFHKLCIKCTVCGIVLNEKSMESYNKLPYCRAHLVNAKKGGGVQDMRNPLGKGPIVSAETKVEGGDQSTENQPERSNISYETHNPNQSTENNPEKSTVRYEAPSQDQSTESKPRTGLGQTRSAPVQQSRPAPAPVQQSRPAPAPVPPPVQQQQEEESYQQEEQQQEESYQQEEQQQESYQQEEQQQSSAYTVGAQCTAQYSADGQFYAAVIEEVSDGQYLVRYTEYDETEWVSEDKIQL